MSVQFNLTQQATSPTAPQTTIRQAAKEDDNNDSSISSTSSNGKGFIATIMTPFKAVLSFIASIFSKLVRCCCGDSKEVKGLKEQKAALVNVQEKFEAAVLSASRDTEKVAAYQEAVKALAPEQRAGITAKLVVGISQISQFSDSAYQSRVERMATEVLDDLKNVAGMRTGEEAFGRVIFDATANVRASLAEMVKAIDIKLA